MKAAWIIQSFLAYVACNSKSSEKHYSHCSIERVIHIDNIYTEREKRRGERLMGLCLLLLFYCLLIYEAICVQIHKNYKVNF